MKKFFLALFAPLFLMCVGLSPASAQSADWQITLMNSDITVHTDGSLLVKETVHANFFIEKHGIYRDIPVSYVDDAGKTVALGFHLISVTDENGVTRPYTNARDGAYRNIKIGDADTLVSGEQTYVITYEIDHGVRVFDDHDELYWNATGNDWDARIVSANATVHLPFTSPDEIQTVCYTGLYGSTEQNCQSDVLERAVRFQGEDYMTIAVSWPKGYIQIPPPTTVEKIQALFLAYGGYLISLVVAILCFLVWLWRGRDPKGRGIVRQYEAPDGLSPAEVDFLVSEDVSSTGIAAEMVWLANKGFLNIKELKAGGWLGIGADYELTRTDKDAESLKPYQRRLLNDFFRDASTVVMSKLGDRYDTASEIRAEVKQAIGKRYYAGDAVATRAIWVSAGTLIFFLLFAMAVVMDLPGNFMGGAALTGVIIAIFGVIMPRRTQAGVEAYQYAMGFKQYISAAETERVKWEEKENLFFEVLPYAMVFGIADKWAKVFEGKLQKPPQWYTGTTPGFVFSPSSFNRSMDGISAATASHTRPPHSSSSGFSSGGGGFSGGGSGGGGGGSW